MFPAIAQSVLLGWLWRRLQELGSFGAMLGSIYAYMPPHQQAVVGKILTGQGGGLSVTAAAGLLWWLATQWQSYKATTATQVVTTDGQKIVPKKGSVVEAQINEVAVGVKPASLKPTLWDRFAKRS